jgi:pyruvate-ferredoxin/flavodoxin oxidoreductase
MATGMGRQKDAVASGFWPLYRYDPREAHEGGTPFRLDSRKPKLPFRDFAMQEARFAMLTRSDPEHADRLFNLAQQDINDQWSYYEQIANVKRDLADETEEVEA